MIKEQEPPQQKTAGQVFSTLADVLIGEKKKLGQNGPPIKNPDTFKPLLLGLLSEFGMEALPIAENSHPLPTIRINRGEGTASVDGRVVKFRQHSVAWKAFLLLASMSNTDIDGRKIKSVEKQAGSRIKENNGLSSITYLRKYLGDDPSNPLITTTVCGHFRKYRLNAEIEFTEESIFSRKPKREKGVRLDIDFRKGQEEVMLALFSINPQRSGFKNRLIKDVVMDVYGGKMSTVGGEKNRNLLGKYYNALMYARTVSMKKIGRNWNQSSERLPKIRGFIKWLKDQPEYANATLEDLDLVAIRRISFEDLRKKADPTPATRQILPQPSTMPMSIRSEPVQLYPAPVVEENPPQSPPRPRRVVEKAITPLRITVEEPSMLFSVLTFEEIVDLAVNLLGINEQNPTLLRGIGIDPVECDKIRRLITSIKITLESKRRSIKPDGGIVLNRTPLTIKQKLDAFQKNPEAFLQANKVEARILLQRFVKLEKEKLATLLSSLCP